MSGVALIGLSNCSMYALQGLEPPCDDKKKSRPRPKLSGWITSRWWNTIVVQADHMYENGNILHVYADDYGQLSRVIITEKDDNTPVKQTIQITYGDKTIQYDAIVNMLHDSADNLNAILHIIKPHTHHTSTSIEPKRDIDTIAAIYLHLRKRFLPDV